MQAFCLMRRNHWVIDYPVTSGGGITALLCSLLKLHIGPGFLFFVTSSLQGLCSVTRPYNVLQGDTPLWLLQLGVSTRLHFHPCLPGMLYELGLINLDLSFQQGIYKSCSLGTLHFMQFLPWKCLAHCHTFILKNREIFFFFF